nr:integrase, catalytic region, zinc finger, CCHC-type, peptidase aspartic, catalytic [Tanacetum cinerariifolium]
DLKAKKESSDEDSSTSDSQDEEYAMAVKEFKKFGDPNLLIGECPKSPRSNNQRAFIGGACSDSGEDEEEKARDETCLVAQAYNEICLGINLEPDEWINDSGCSKHMMGECPKSLRSNNQRAFIGGACSDSGEDEEEKARDETCLVAQAYNEICLGINLEPDEWINDSGCSKHMMGNQKLFSTYKAYNGGNVIFGSNLR